MQLSSDQTVLWAWHGLKINLTIATTWGLMVVLTVLSRLLTLNMARPLSQDGSIIAHGQSLLEWLVSFMDEQMHEVGLADTERYLPFVGTVFLFVAASSLATILPGYEPPTASLSTTAALAICVLVAVPLFGIRMRGVGAWLRGYLQPVPIMLPFNIISELTRTLALAMRLFGNMMGDGMILGILLTIAPLFFPVVMKLLGLLTGMVQAYIFSILTMVYIAAVAGEREMEKA